MGIRTIGHRCLHSHIFTYLLQGYDRRMASSHMSTDASSSMFTNWESRGAWGGMVDSPPPPPPEGPRSAPAPP